MSKDRFQLTGNAAEVYEAQKVKAIFGPLARATLDMVSLTRDDRVLDLACGTGIVARTVQDRIAPATPIAGADLNEGMIATARRLTADQAGRFDWRVADAGALPFGDGAFTAVFCQQGIQFFPDDGAVVAEISRVLAPNGLIVLTVWSGPNAFFTEMAQALGRHAGAEVGQRSLAPFQYTRHARLQELILAAGFRDLSSRRVQVDRVVQQPETSIAQEILGNPVGATVSQLGDAVMRTVVAEIIAATTDYRRGDDLVFLQEAHLITARAG